jgi:hypothetical protein
MLDKCHSQFSQPVQLTTTIANMLAGTGVVHRQVVLYFLEDLQQALSKPPSQIQLTKIVNTRDSISLIARCCVWLVLLQPLKVYTKNNSGKKHLFF